MSERKTDNSKVPKLVGFMPGEKFKTSDEVEQAIEREVEGEGEVEGEVEGEGEEK